MPRRAGFTLVEVMVALSLSALVVLLAHRVFAGVLGGAERLDAARGALDRESNARRFLHEVFGSLDVGLTEGASFVGRPDRVEFTTWLRVPEGWLERRRITLSVEGGRFAAAGETDAPIVLRDGIQRLDLDYLLEPGANEAWVREWVSPVSAPVAVRIRITGVRVDTLLVLVGPRG